MKLFSRFFWTGITVLLGYSVLTVVPFHAQTGTAKIYEEVWKTAAKLDDLGARVQRNEQLADALERRVQTVEVEIASVKTTVEQGNKLAVGCLSGVLLILLDRGMALILKNKGKS